MIEPNPPITGQAAKLSTTRVDDDITLVCVVHLNAKPVFAECCAVSRDGTSRRVGKSPSGWKVDSVSAQAFDDGTVRMWLSSYPDSASGTEAAVRYIDFPDAVSPAAAGGYVEAPGGAVRVFDGSAGFAGETTILLAPWGIPPGVLLNLSARVSGPKAGLVGRVGPDTIAGPAWNAGPMLNVFTQEPNVYMFGVRPVKASADNTLLVVAELGEVNLLVDIYGWWG